MITRRQFLKYCSVAAGALGLSAATLYKLNELMAYKLKRCPRAYVQWLNGAGCTGCTISLLNTINAYSIQGLIAPLDTIETTLLGGAVDLGPDGPLELNFIETLNTAVGARAVDAAFDLLNSICGFILCIEGAIQTESDGRYCQIWRVHKEHATLESGSFVWASADREALKVPNDPSEPIKVVNPIGLSGNRTNSGIIELHIGSVLAANSDLSVVTGTWVEKQADRDAFIAQGYGFSNNKVSSGGALISAITLTGRIEVIAGNLLATGSKISSCSLVYNSADRIALGGIYVIAPRVKTGITRTILSDTTLTGTVMIAGGSKLMPGTVLKIGTWVESLSDRTAIGGSYDTDNKIQYGDITLTYARTFSGRVEALSGSTLVAREVDSANYLYSSSDEDRAFMDEVLNFAISDNCVAVVGVGTCASYGGIPAANGSVTGARGLISTGSISGGYQTVYTQGYWDWLLENCKITRAQWEALMCKTICVPGCPPHPDWIIGTLSSILIADPPVMDKYFRPLSYYGEYQCTNCLWRVNDTTQGTDDIDGNAPLSKSGRTIGNSPKLYYYKYDSSYEGCIGILGCKGRKTKADCSYRRWNGDGPGGIAGVLAPGFVSQGKGGVSWCVLTRAGCHGCTEPRFPDGWGPFFMYK